MINKVYILTIFRCLNNGSVLQAFALKSILERICDHKVEVVNYNNTYIFNRNYYIKYESLVIF
jgi:hypothetical protein